MPLPLQSVVGSKRVQASTNPQIMTQMSPFLLILNGTQQSMMRTIMQHNTCTTDKEACHGCCVRVDEMSGQRFYYEEECEGQVCRAQVNE